MKVRRQGWVGCLSLVLLLVATTGQAHEQRRNTVSFGMQGLYGLMSGTGEYVVGERVSSAVSYDTFDYGPGIAVNLKYSLDRRHAIGVTFDDLRFNRKSGQAPGVSEQLQVNNVLARYYTYFKRRGKTSRNVFVGAGFHRPAFRVDERENILPGEGFSANYGVGLEYFLSRAATIDVTVEGYYLKPPGGTVTTGQVKFGLHYYFTR